MRAVLLGAVAISAVVTGASARDLYINRDQYNIEGTPVDALPTPFSHGGSCIKACRNDDTPCDPDYWKVADRRCNINQNGGY